jgi:transcriptional regulator with XRE-family HTH domain
MTGAEALTRLKLYQLKHGLTQRQLAYVVGTDETTISRWRKWGKVGRYWMKRLDEHGFLTLH